MFADLKAGSRSHRAICALWGTICDNSSQLGISLFFMVENNTNDPDRIQASNHIHQEGTELMHQQIPITESMIENMIGRAEFPFNDPIIIDVPSQLSSTTIYLRMRGIHSEQTSFYPISGFPRKLVAQDTINGTFLSVFTMLHWLSQKPESRLDKRAELIKERRYGVLAVASDPSITLPGHENRAVVSPTNKTQQTRVGEESPLTRADSAESATATTPSTRRTSPSHASSQTLASQVSDTSSSSASKAAWQGVPIAELRAQAKQVTQTGHGRPVTIENGDELSNKMSAALLLGDGNVGLHSMEPDFGSDDSDGPPSEGDDQDTE